MSMLRRLVRNRFVVGASLLAAVIAGAALTTYGGGGFIGRVGAVGGILIDADGVVRNAEVADQQRLAKLRQELLRELPADLSQGAELRCVSLRRLQEAIRQRQQRVEMPIVTQDMELLAGLTRVQYVLVYPEHNDIVLAGPADVPVVDKYGNVVGRDTGRAIVQLDHLLVALRTAEQASRQVISCSIEPTPEGLERLQRYLATQTTYHPGIAQGVEQALGPQVVKIQGVSLRSDFARTMVAADYRMKRIAMAMDPSGLRAVPSYLQMAAAGTTGLQNATPRWWMAPNYEALHRDADGLAWELRGPGIKVLTEDTLIAEGARPSGKSSGAAQKWAELMTQHFDELSLKHPIFGEMRNVMDLAVVAALITKERLADRAGCDLSLLMDARTLPTDEDFDVAPKEVPTLSSVVKKGTRYMVTASGGVEVNGWAVVQKFEQSATMAPLRADVAHAGNHWWW
jgi:hypothetical protein